MSSVAVVVAKAAVPHCHHLKRKNQRIRSLFDDILYTVRGEQGTFLIIFGKGRL